MGAATPSPERPTATHLRCGATLLGELLVVRCLAQEPEVLRNLFEALWCELRPDLARARTERTPSLANLRGRTWN